MQEQRLITGQTEEAICQQLAEDMQQHPDLLQYQVLLQQAPYQVLFRLDVDLGGGFESGISSTLFSATLQKSSGYRFRLQQQGLLEEVGKLLGMQDIKIGDSEFDAHTLVQANQEEKVKQMLSQPDVRSPFLQLSDYQVELTLPGEANEPARLDFWIQEAITDPIQLCQLYHSFMALLKFSETDQAL
ncbi:hypothetical protein ACMA1I_21500 [Pontibacter sp. 13R65]|uniref:hypothetical protein n=1 Tax=Pontibacter sp. 13R65 TaxID=3127458 RepID=UPI00301E5346